MVIMLQILRFVWPLVVMMRWFPFLVLHMEVSLSAMTVCNYGFGFMVLGNDGGVAAY